MVKNGIRFRQWSIPIIALMATATYVVVAYTSDLTGEPGLPGFPLDDAWIHQTYARNLAETGQLAYLPGQPSAGSTSPAWSFLLSVAYLVGLDYHLWAFLLGGLSLAVTAWLAYRLFLRLPLPGQRSTQALRPAAALLAGLFCAIEWHLVWAAASGMETVFFTALSLALLEYAFGHIADREAESHAAGPASLRTERTIVSAVGIGLLGGLLTVTRPEGLGLFGLVFIALLIFPRPPSRSELGARFLAAAVALLGYGLLVVPYLNFNLQTAGSLFPNTFYAKQAEYLAILSASLPARFWRVLSSTLVGAQVLLVPGFCYAAYHLIRHRRWLALLPLVWWLAFLAVYALRLPVTYQHGRYLIPTIPILILYGAWGTAALVRPRSPQLLVRVLSQALPLALALLALYFFGRGAVAYRDDVGVIEGEMVATAHWLNEHTTPEDLIAVHDIGAVGYLTDHPLLDLAGLISPEVIPFITDAEQLADWMIEHGATHAVFFPDFSSTYVQLAADPRLRQVYCTGYAWTRSVGQQNMCVYTLSEDE
jgi:arabinofuranosyltransferase